MSKYVIDLRPDCKVVQQICASNENVSVGARSIVLLDELTDDYIKENFKDLLEGEYQRGFEDGKLLGQNESWECARKIVCDGSCGGMSMKELLEIFNKRSDAYIIRDFTAQQAIEMLKAYEKKQKADDKIKVGDVVMIKQSKHPENHLFVVTKVSDESVWGVEGDGSWNYWAINEVIKTSKHFDIAKILEDMRK